jgi:hypothetical protein
MEGDTIHGAVDDPLLLHKGIDYMIRDRKDAMTDPMMASDPRLSSCPCRYQTILQVMIHLHRIIAQTCS